MNEVQRQQYRGNEAALAWHAEVGTAGGDDRAPASNGGEWDHGVVHPGSSGSLAACGALMGGAGVFGDIKRADRVFGEHLARPAN